MSDFEDSDEERYAIESFENETDNEVLQNTEIESEVSENSDDMDNNREEEEEEDEYINDDEDDLPSVKLNTGPIKRNSFSNNYTKHRNTDVVPFASSSDEESDVIVGQTLAEINTPSMNFIDEPQKPTFRQFESKGNSEHHYVDSANEEELVSSEEIGEEENDEDEDEEAEFKRIQEMEEKYVLQNSAKTPKLVHEDTAEESEKENHENASEEENISDVEDEEMDEEEETEVHENDDGDEVQEYEKENIMVNECQEELSNDNLEKEPFKKEKNDLVEVIENTITNLKLLTERNNQEDENPKTSEMLQLAVTDENINVMFDSSKMLNSEATVTVIDKDEQEVEKKHSEDSLNQNDKSDTDDYSSNEQEQETEIERVESNANNFQDFKRSKYDEGDADAYYTDRFDYRITSKTPTSFNSDDYIFHANLIKQIHRTNSTDKLRPKPHPRKSMSFSNDRMREIERHNQILLRKILTQKPTYNLKGKSSPTFIQKIPAQQSGTRLTNSAVNRKKQQRQIDIDNQILKRKIEAIAMRRKPLIS